MVNRAANTGMISTSLVSVFSVESWGGEHRRNAATAAEEYGFSILCGILGW